MLYLQEFGINEVLQLKKAVHYIYPKSCIKKPEKGAIYQVWRSIKILTAWMSGPKFQLNQSRTMLYAALWQRVNAHLLIRNQMTFLLEQCHIEQKQSPKLCEDSFSPNSLSCTS